MQLEECAMRCMKNPNIHPKKKIKNIIQENWTECKNPGIGLYFQIITEMHT